MLGIAFMPRLKDLADQQLYKLDVEGALAAAALGRRNSRLDALPLGIGEIAWIAQLVTIVTAAVLGST